MRLLTAVFALLLLFGLVHQASAEDRSFSLKNLSKIAKDKKVSSVEDLLERLPSFLYDKYVLVRSSHSMQGSSEPSPRAILWNEETGFAMSFNGDPEERGYDSVETFQFDKATRTLTFAQITFAEGRADVTQPAICLRCHGTSPRPVWQAYPFWTDSYGSEDDHFVPGEKSAFSDFKKSAGNHNRYKYLARAMGEYDVAPFRDGPGKGPLSLDNTLLRRPNLRFNIFVNRLNAQRLSRNLEAQLPEQDLKALTRSILECPGAEPIPAMMIRLNQPIQEWNMKSTFLNKSAYTDPHWDRPYFDGSATIMELVGARLIEFLFKKGSTSLDPKSVEWSLDLKYDPTLDHYALQRPAVLALDKFGGWSPIPFVSDDEFTRVKRVPLTAAQKHRWKKTCQALN